MANDFLAGLRDLENTRVSIPATVEQLVRRLINSLIIFLAGCWIGAWLNDKPRTEVDAMMNRIMLRAQLMQEERNFEQRAKTVEADKSRIK